MLRKVLAASLLMAAPAFAQDVPDLPGPNLVLEISGEANGRVVIDLLSDKAPKHVEQIVTLAKEGAYDGVSFHRVIEGFMAQTGDVAFGNPAKREAAIAALPKGQTPGSVMLDGMEIPAEYVGPGIGGSHLPDLPAEFSDISFDRGIVGMARSQDPNSANSQFFIMLAPNTGLDGQYTVVGRVIEGMDVVDKIKRGPSELNGAVAEPADLIVRASVEAEAAPAAEPAGDAGAVAPKAEEQPAETAPAETAPAE
ncbi:peptidylprolyl isomerase [Xinfangfangia sp. D13-10-4-6]|uniref:peptidylprolyl isomerase n=1 Tax=Pseudogemmobacter hezensis TaxID=2737662 RepID=UPI001556F55F|nr:peptidylprolyl isomerase [Pseudogemmobacter hezensis]NPD16867.1 peptidylprolyl isomerase [Pseudogemmobacter hezensis]